MSVGLLPFPGLCIYLKNEHGTEHLTIIAATDGNDLVALTSVTSAHPWAKIDHACMLNPGDHTFIRQASFVAYERAVIGSITALRQAIDDKIARRADPLTEAVLTRVLEGALKSPRTPRDVRDFIKKHRP